MIDIPGFNRVAVALFTVAIVGSEEVNFQTPSEFDVGATKVRVLGRVEEKVVVTSGNTPRVGSAARTVTVIETDPDA